MRLANDRFLPLGEQIILDSLVQLLNNKLPEEHFTNRTVVNNYEHRLKALKLLKRLQDHPIVQDEMPTELNNSLERVKNYLTQH